MLIKNMKLIHLVAFFCLICGAGYSQTSDVRSSGDDNWKLSALPSSVRLDPSDGRIIENRSDIYTMNPLGRMLEKNWIYDGKTVSLHAARGEYVSFQLVLENKSWEALKDIIIDMTPFA